MYEQLSLYINGRFHGVEGRETEPVENPATGETLGLLPHATHADLDEAVEAAATAFASWKTASGFERSGLLRQAASLIRQRSNAIAETLTLEQGKTLGEALGEVLVAADIFDWHAEEARRLYGRIIPGRLPNVRQMVLHEPVGPCALFTPWNFPALTPARKLAAALAAGCTAVLKPSEETPGTAVAIVRALHDAGVPPGVVNLVFGHPDTISRRLIARREIRKISFTGSTLVGKHLLHLAADGLKRTTMELGGNAPVIICEDADLELAVSECVKFKYRNAGQVCIAPSRFLVHESIAAPFAEAFAQRSAALRLGNGLDAASHMGPLANARRLDQIEEMVENARASGGTITTGGRRLHNAGHFFEPTVITGAALDSMVFTREIFGPVAPVTSFSSLDEGLTLANSVSAGLAAYGFTRGRDNANRLIAEIEAGMVGINGFAVSTPETPFGGIKESGHGQEGGSEGVQAYLNVKFVSES